MAERRRLHPVVWTVLGGVAGLLLGYDWADPAALSVKIDIAVLGLVAGVLATILVASWPRERPIPDAACPRCGYRMKWDVVVCPECGEIR